MSSGSSHGRTSAVGVAEEPSKNLLAPKGVIILPKAVVPKETDLKGEITIGPGTVLHPSARILAVNGPIIIGEGNIIEEKAEIRNCFPIGADGIRRTLYIGSKNLFEAYSVVEGCVGNNNSILCKGRIGPQTSLSNGCVVGVMCQMTSDETVSPDTVIIGQKHHRRVAELPQIPPFIDEHLEFLQRQFPTYHYLLKSSL